jgi:hypothetical protein
MTLKGYIITMGIMTSLCVLSCVYVLFTVNPEATNWIGFTLFYVSLTFSLIGVSALLGFLFRFIILKKELAFRLVKDAFRQSFLFSALIVISLFLLSKGMFSWLNLVFLVVGLTVLEFFWLSYENNI